MRLFLAASAILLATSTFAAAPARAQQGGTHMWCTAWTEAPAEKAY